MNIIPQSDNSSSIITNLNSVIKSKLWILYLSSLSEGDSLNRDLKIQCRKQPRCV